ncbi:MAG: isoprenylcysteine carboxylmethyltransferase family protein [Lutibacter sp.]|uniref:methyltransferase family protein n=1 Tax=Lutibacter sp. TaxID=1925666 RepID=UPI00299F388A|nr:isoprenylcysteine carboxylmethyltransferase family protein [Lutibacter sp.]MDX1830156.1 isoprenylcysteine carboxylmethyltransferase family protein [Lutibacter sp.]
MQHIIIAIVILFSSSPILKLANKLSFNLLDTSYLFVGVYVFWFLSEVVLNRIFISKKEDSKSKDKGTLNLIWVLIFIANFLAIYLTNYNFRIAEGEFISYLGLLIICIGVILRLTIILSLGKFFTVNVTIKEDHRLKTNGFYKYLRHPSYTASLLSFIGFGISLNNWFSLLIIFIIILTAFLIRIKTEEKVLVNYFGVDYLNYRKSTKKIIPFIY